MHQRAALEAGKDRHIELFGERFVIPQDDARTRSAKAFVGCAGDDVAMGEGRGMSAACHKAGDMAHIAQQNRTHFIGNRTESAKIPCTRIGRSAANDDLGFVLASSRSNSIHIDEFIVLAHAIADRVEPFAAHIDRRTMG